MSDHSEIEVPAIPPFIDTRELKRPYFLLRVRGGEKPFYAGEIQGIIRDSKSPFTAYLPAAEMDDPQKPGVVTFALPKDIDRSTLTRMDRLPESTIRAFRSAAETFINAEGLDPYRRQIRESFQLPDPDEEPDAWWVYGPPQDRRLLILWGCEFQRGSSLPLLPDPKKPNQPTILDRLQNRRMQWTDYQSQVRDLLLAGKEPLSRFIARPEKDRKGEWKSLLHRGRRLDWEKTRPLKTIGSSEIKAFGQAATAFLQQAHPDTDGISEYEKELRANFRLPDLEKCPELFRVVGGKLAIAIPDQLSHEQTLCPVEDEELGLPAPETGEGGAEIIPETVADQLQSRATPWMARSIAAGVLLVLLIAAAVLFEAFADRTPPRIVEAISENTPQLIAVTFNKPIDPEHLEFAEKVTPEEEARGRADIPVFTLANESGRRVTIAEVNLLETGSIVELRTREPMPEGSYTLTVLGAQDTTRKRNRIEEPLEFGFQVLDTLPPRLEQVSADLRDPAAVLLLFNEPLDRASASLRTNYQIGGKSILRAELLEDSTVRLLANAPFEKDQPYTLEVITIQDASLSRNPIPEPIIFPFSYRDTIPPEIISVEAPRSQLEILLRFSEKVTPESAEVPANYTVTVDGNPGPAVRSARLLDDQITVTLATEPLYNSVDYALAASNVTDLGGGNIIAMEEPVPFRFTGQEDRSPPAIERVVPMGRRVFVVFNKPVETDALLDASRWVFADNALSLEGSPVLSDAEGRRIRITVTERPENRNYTLTFNGELRDLLGNEAVTPLSIEFPGSPSRVTTTNTLMVSAATPSPERDRLVVQFNEAVVREELARSTNYRLTGDGTIRSAEPDPVDPARVILTLESPLQPDTSYGLTIRNLRAQKTPGESIPELTFSFSTP